MSASILPFPTPKPDPIRDARRHLEKVSGELADVMRDLDAGEVVDPAEVAILADEVVRAETNHARAFADLVGVSRDATYDMRDVRRIAVNMARANAMADVDDGA